MYINNTHKERKNDYKNQRWTIKQIAEAYQYENPEMDWKECLKKAKEVHRGLRALNKNIKDNNSKYYNKFVPLSTFECDNGEYMFFKTNKTEDDYIR